MADSVINAFTKGVHNLIDPENIPQDAAQDALGYVTQDGKIILAGGRKAVGTEGTLGKITMLHAGYKTNGSKVLFAKFGTEIKYFNGTAWITVISGLGENTEYSAANYSSLAGAFVFFNGADGYFKVVTANPGSYIDIYDAAKNFKGKIVIDKGRTLLWARAEDKTGLYGSKIDPQNSSVYTAVTGEVLGVSGSITYSGTLAFKGAGPKRNCFAVSISGTTGAGVETFTDNYLGGLTGNLGGSGTINYATGAYSVTFNGVVTAGNVTANYQWEDSTVGSLADFTHAATRLAGEGFQFPQDEGGDAIENVIVSPDGSYFSLKTTSAYQLFIESDDLTATNSVYRKDIGIPYWRAAVSTTFGVIFLNTANPTKPEMTLLEKSPIGNVIIPKVLFPHFKFSNYDYSDCALSTFDRWILVQCKGDSEVNDTLLLCNVSEKTVDVVNYSGRIAVKDGDDLYVGDSIRKAVYQIFSEFDDLGDPIINHWTSKDEMYGVEQLKKFRRLRFKGVIGLDQLVSVYVDYDSNGFQKIGSIWGGGPYVNKSDPQSIGGPIVGSSPIGGLSGLTGYPFFMEIKQRVPKFRKRTIMLVAENIGYFALDSVIDFDILTFEKRIPKIYREKQNVSLDGQTNDLPNP